MRKIIFIILLLISDILLYRYLCNIIRSKKCFEYKLDDIAILYNTNDINLNNTNEFKFENYFDILCLNNKEYKYSFEDENIIIILNNNEYKFKYKINEPEIIEKYVYLENENEVHNIDTSQYATEDYFYVLNKTLRFNLNEDMNVIREALINNLITTYQTSIDYSYLNISQIGQYSVFYVSENETIEIIVEIF